MKNSNNKASNVLYKTRIGTLKVLGQKEFSGMTFYQVYDKSINATVIMSKRLFKSILVRNK